MKTLEKKYRPNNKYRVIAGLSMDNKELRERVKNRSIIINHNGKSYTDEMEIERALRKSSVETERDWLKTERKNQELKGKIETNLKNAQKSSENVKKESGTESK